MWWSSFKTDFKYEHWKIDNPGWNTILHGSFVTAQLFQISWAAAKALIESPFFLIHII